MPTRALGGEGAIDAASRGAEEAAGAAALAAAAESEIVGKREIYCWRSPDNKICKQTGGGFDAAATSLQVAMRGWLARRARRRRLERRRAQLERRCQAQAERAAAATRLQAAARGWRARLQLWRGVAAAVALAAVGRGFGPRRALRLARAAATLLQSAARGAAARRRHERGLRAAVALQAAARRIKARGAQAAARRRQERRQARLERRRLAREALAAAMHRAERHASRAAEACKELAARLYAGEATAQERAAEAKVKAAEAKTLQSKLGWAREMRDQEYAAERQAERAREVEAEHARLRRLAAALSEVDFQVGQRERAPPECGIDAHSGFDSGFGGGLGRAQRAAWLHWEQVLQEEEASGWYAEVYAFCHNVPWASGTSCEASDDPWDAAAADFRRACRVLEPLDYAEPRYFCGQDVCGRSACEQREEVLLDLAAEVRVRHGVRDLFVRPGSAVGFAAVGLHSADETEAEAAAAAEAAADKNDQEQGPDPPPRRERREPDPPAMGRGV